MENRNGKNFRLFFLITPFILWSFLISAQKDSIKKYEYEICIYNSPKEKPKLLKNELAGIADTTLSIIRGQIFDFKKNPIPYSVISFENKEAATKSGCLADSLGSFIIYLKTGNYNFTAKSVGYSDFNFDELQLKPGHIRQLELILGEAGCFRTFVIQSDKPLSKRKLKKSEKHLKQKY